MLSQPCLCEDFYKMIDLNKYDGTMTSGWWCLNNVCILSKDSELITHCTPDVAKHLIHRNIAKVVELKPFTIRVESNCVDRIQEAEVAIELKKIKNQKNKELAKLKRIEKKNAPKKKSAVRFEELYLIVNNRKKEIFKILELSVYEYNPVGHSAYVNMLTEDELKDYKRLRMMIVRRSSPEKYVLRRKRAGVLPDEYIKEIGEAQNWQCYYCTKDVREKYHKDHYKAVVLEGRSTQENMVIACARCNLRKQAKTPDAWYEHLLKYGADGFPFQNSLFFKRIRKERFLELISEFKISNH